MSPTLAIVILGVIAWRDGCWQRLQGLGMGIPS